MVGINTNVMALRAQRSLSENNTMVGNSVHRLSTGLRINSAADDAAGLAISKRMDAQAAGLGAAERNANDGISLLKTAEGALQETSNILIRMKELATQSANGTNSSSDRQAINSEFDQLKQEITRIAENANFNGLNVLDGSFNNKGFQVGVNASESINITIKSATGQDLSNSRVNDYNASDNQGSTSLTAAVSGAATANTIETQTVNVAGTSGNKNITVADSSSAKTIAGQVNASTSTHGVTATAHTEVRLSELSEVGTVSFKLSTSDITTETTIQAAITDTDDLSALADAINSSSGTTGVTATYDTGTLNLIQANGADIRINDFAHTDAGSNIKANAIAVKNDGSKVVNGSAETLTDSGADTTVVSGSIFFDSPDTFSVTSSIAAADGSIINVAGDTSKGSTAETIANSNVSEAASSQAAMRVIDSALSQINSQRADLGATQNRFNSTISNIKTSTENIMAASSQIKDADYAKETTALTKAQILSQAATAMLAQANQSGQGVLSLLQ